MAAAQQGSGKRTSGWVKWAIAVFWVGFLLAISANVLYIQAVSEDWGGLFGGMPNTDKLLNPKSELASEVFSSDGVSLGKYFRENRTPVRYPELSPNLINALLATEDIRFEEHSGIDFLGTASIIGYALIGKKRGGSTITQQLAKNLFNTRSELYEGKLTNIPLLKTGIAKSKEWILAIKLERTYSKKEIMEMYFNTVHFGSNSFGIKTAAATFFKTTPAKLKVEEAAVLVGILKAPSLYSPIYRPENSLRRRNTVLEQMEKYNFISRTQTDSLKQMPIALNYGVESHNEGSATYFRAEIRKDLLRFCRENNKDLFADGLKVYTTIDSRFQQLAEAAMEKHMRELQRAFFNYWRGRNPWVDDQGREIKGFLETAARRSDVYKQFLSDLEGDEKTAWELMQKKVPMKVFSWERKDIDTLISPLDSIRYYKNFLRAGMMSMNPNTGEIKAWVGGINFRYFKYDHVRQGRRQPGSSFKPFVYAAALSQGFNPCYKVVDAPVTFHTPGGQPEYWTPKNSDGNFSGEWLTLRTAMARSINSVTAAMVQKIGIQSVVEMAKRLGIESPLDPVPPLCLGASDVSLYEMVGAYSAFVNKGVWTRPYYITRIEDKNGNVLKRFTPERKEAISEDLAYAMVHMLKGSTIERNGTALGLYRLGNTLRGGNEVGGKTGTTSNYSDGWFVGITKDLVTGIWVGGEDRSIHFRTMNLGQGSRMAMPIWSFYMDALYEKPELGITKGPFPKPQNMEIPLDCNALENPSNSDSLQQRGNPLPSVKDLKDDF